MIDVGGPTMVRAAAKNHDNVAVVVDPAEYGAVLDELRRDGAVSPTTRRRLARQAFAHTAAYDAAIVSWLDAGGAGDGANEVLPPTLHLALERCQPLRYGENPHQRGARYRRLGEAPGWWDGVVQHGGRELSYLNLFDAEAAWQLVHELLELDGVGAAAVIVKHANPCGAAIADDLPTAYGRAFAADPVSAFGGIVALSGPVDLALAKQIVANALADVLVAPGITAEAVELFAERRKNMRPLSAPPPGADPLVLRQISGGFLVQEPDRFLVPRSAWRVVTEGGPRRGAVARRRAGLARLRPHLVERDRPRPRGQPCWASAAASRTGSTRRCWRRARPTAGPLAASRPPTPSSPSATGSTPWPTRAWPSSSSREGRFATTR